jgi:hypothetical protein
MNSLFYSFIKSHLTSFGRFGYGDKISHKQSSIQHKTQNKTEKNTQASKIPILLPQRDKAPQP